MGRVKTGSVPFLAIDRGRATTSVAVIGPMGGRWRLLAARSMPATVELDAVIAWTLEGLRSADPALAADLHLRSGAQDDLERVEVRTQPPGTIASITATDRGRSILAPILASSGWRATSATIATHDPRAMTALLLDPSVRAVIAAADQRAGADERGGLDDLGALLGGVASRRPDLAIVLSGAMAGQEARIRNATVDGGRIVLAPDSRAGSPPGSDLRDILAALGRATGDARWSLVAGLELLGEALDRGIELLDVGASGGLRAVVDPPASGSAGRATAQSVADAALVGLDVDDDTLGGVATWSTTILDRHRLHDRLAEIVAHPWADSTGDGARLRMAAARAALARLIAATPDLSARGAPDLVVVSGGVWAVAPSPAISLAIADVVRRPGATQLAYDHARILAPIGSIGDRDVARRIISDIADDLLAPLGGLIMPRGLRPGRAAGELTIHLDGDDDGADPVTLVPGTIEYVDLPPGVTAKAELALREPIVLGGRGRHFTVDVAGGLGGLLVDLRDIPMALPERSDLRRDLLASWQDAIWPADAR